jgi:hypothetical protein
LYKNFFIADFTIIANTFDVFFLQPLLTKIAAQICPSLPQDGGAQKALFNLGTHFHENFLDIVRVIFQLLKAR